MAQQGWYQRRSTPMTEQELQGYAGTRRKLYPKTYFDDHPSEEAEADFNAYKTSQFEAEQSMGKYDAEYERRAGDEPVGALSMDKHKLLVHPAAKAEVDTADHAHTRDRFLVNHPYGYRTHTKRVQHDGYVDDAYDQANHYRHHYDTHSRITGGNPPALKPARHVGKHTTDPHPSRDTYYYDTYYDDDDDDEDDREVQVRGSRRAKYYDSSDEGDGVPEPSRTGYAASSSGFGYTRHSRRPDGSW